VSFLTVCLNPTIQKTLRFSEVVPGTVNRTGEHRIDVSGKGINVSRVLTQLGKKVTHLTQLGGVMRPLFLSLCGQDGLSVEWVESGSEIRFCYTIINGVSHPFQVTELVEESDAVSSQKTSHKGTKAQRREEELNTEEMLVDKFDFLLSDIDLSCLIVSGTKAAGFSDEVIPLMVKKAKDKGLRVVLDVKGKDLIESLQYKPDIIKPNLFEFAETFAPELVKGNDSVANDTAAQERIKSAALDISKKYSCGIILTNGSRKIITIDRDNYFETDIQPVIAVNTTGCGDAFTAGLASALEDGADFRAAIAEGIRCGALNAGLVRPGVIC
jgi:fructose-1-phosphate kinase PfkB-like protein